MAKANPSTQNFIEIKSIEDDIIILKDGSFRQIAIVSGINLDLMSEEEQNSILFLYQRFLNSLDFPIQILIHSRKFNIENYIKNISELEKVEENELLKNQIFEYKEFIKTFIKENDIMNKMFLVVIPFIPANILPQKGFFSKIFPFGKNKKINEAVASKTNQEKQIYFRQLRQRTDQVISGIQSIGLRAVVLNNEELLELFYNLYNPEAVGKEGFKISSSDKNKSTDE